MLRISERVEGARVAPATPSSARLTMSIPALVENAARTEVMLNTTAPISSSAAGGARSGRPACPW
jgi:hypothetical protein